MNENRRYAVKDVPGHYVVEQRDKRGSKFLCFQRGSELIARDWSAQRFGFGRATERQILIDAKQVTENPLGPILELPSDAAFES